MKHDRSHRRDVRRHADPSVICLPGPKPALAMPRKEPEASPAPPLPIPDDEMLDAELLAHKNIFEVPPRMSRQARRKALRAERKAARRAVTERFIAGAPSLGEAAAQFSVAAMPVALAEDMVGDAVMEAGTPDEGEVMIAERPDSEATEETEEIEVARAEKHEDMMAEAELLEPAWTEEAEEPIALEEIAQLISASGPLIIERIEPKEVPVVQKHAPSSEMQPSPAMEEAAEEMEDEPPEWLVRTSAAPAVPIEAMTTPLPRNRALVPAKRSWLMRLMPWRRSRNVRAPEPALAELHELRFELVSVLQRLDQIIDRLPEGAR